MAQESSAVVLQTLYAPYFPVVAFVAIPEQVVEFAHRSPKRVAISSLVSTGDATHDTDDNMQSQRAELGNGGRISDASQVEPVVGHDAATVLEGV
jgi:hypothetical protein